MTATTLGDPEPPPFYDAAPLEPLLLYQGEILIDVPILAMPKPSRWLLLRTQSGASIQQALKAGQTPGKVLVKDSNATELEWERTLDGDHVMARLARRPALVISQTCDISNADFVSVAPIYDLLDATGDHIQLLKDGKVYKAFYLAPHEATPKLAEGYADLSLIQAVHQSYLKKIVAERHFRLSPISIRLLQRHITRLFGRPNCFDADSDKAPETGIYQCVECFYLDGIVSAREFERDHEFRRCDTCDGRMWVRRGR